MRRRPTATRATRDRTRRPTALKGELDAWLARDPIELYAKKLESSGELGGRTLDEIRDEQRSFIDDAEAVAVASPSGSVEQMFAHVFAP